MFIVNMRPFKDAVQALIDSVDRTKEGWAERLHASILESADEHKTASALKVPQFATQIVKLVQADNTARAKKLVNVLDDDGITSGTVTLVRITLLLIKLGLLAGFVVLVIWGYSRCTGT